MNYKRVFIILFSLFFLVLPASAAIDFTADVTSGEVPLTVHFTNITTPGEGGTSHLWNFGDEYSDGDCISILESPTFTYHEPGVYTVRFDTTVGGDYDVVKTDYITVYPRTLTSANFTANVTEGTSPLSVQFEDNSTSVQEVERLTNGGWESGSTTGWTMGNIQYYEIIDQLPFDDIGTYQLYWNEDRAGYHQVCQQSVNLTNVKYVTFAHETAFPEENQLYIVMLVDSDEVYNTSYDPGGYYFGSADVSGYTGVHTLKFGIQNYVEGSLGLGEFDEISAIALDPDTNVTYSWDLNGDSEEDSTDETPVYNYETAGTYNVSLLLTNTAGNDTETKTEFIVVSESSGSGSGPTVAIGGVYTMGAGSTWARGGELWGNAVSSISTVIVIAPALIVFGYLFNRKYGELLK